MGDHVMKMAELKKQSVDQLNKELIALHKEQFNLRMQKVTGEVAQTHLFSRVRRAIARIKTILREKEGS
jgi:large subunit ribosomal protein L29